MRSQGASLVGEMDMGRGFGRLIYRAGSRQQLRKRDHTRPAINPYRKPILGVRVRLPIQVNRTSSNRLFTRREGYPSKRALKTDILQVGRSNLMLGYTQRVWKQEES